jgi:methyl-accepting chemotaxis protein-1 (serine sensor receptor)
MKHLSVKQQLTIAFTTMAALVLLVSAVALAALGAADGRLAAYVNQASRREGLVVALRAAVNQRAIAARDIVFVKTDAERAAERAKAQAAHARVQQGLHQLDQALRTDADVTARDRMMVQAITDVEARYAPVALDIVATAYDGRRDEAADKIDNRCRPLLAALQQATEDYVAHARQEADAEVAGSRSAFERARWLLGVASGVAVLAAIGLALAITRRLLASMGAEPAVLCDAVGRVAAGDLRPVPGARQAREGSVLASLGAMQGQLERLIRQVRTTADSVATASVQIAHGNQDLSNRTEAQAAALQRTASSMEQLGATVQQNADHAQQANQLALGASSVAAHGGQAVGEVVATMNDIDASSQRIADIIGVIDGIAFQTNILALNAAVEAARAGEQGRGFAVVAAEVRSLAQRSAEAAREIKTLISASVERVEQGASVADRAGATMNDVVASIRRVTDIMGEISAASVEQSIGVAQVAEAVGQMDRGTQQNAALVEQSAAAAESLREQAQQLVQAVSAFLLDESDGHEETRPRDEAPLRLRMA